MILNVFYRTVYCPIFRRHRSAFPDGGAAKQEPADRRVPIHSDLREIVARRIIGKPSEDVSERRLIPGQGLAAFDRDTTASVCRARYIPDCAESKRCALIHAAVAVGPPTRQNQKAMPPRLSA